jgi:hypothetical protein
VAVGSGVEAGSGVAVGSGVEAGSGVAVGARVGVGVGTTVGVAEAWLIANDAAGKMAAAAISGAASADGSSPA